MLKTLKNEAFSTLFRSGCERVISVQLQKSSAVVDYLVCPKKSKLRTECRWPEYN